MDTRPVFPRTEKGTHRAVDALQRAVWKVSKNPTRPCWALKCDIKRFYDSVDHEILKETLAKVINDDLALHLVGHVIDSFHVEGAVGKAAPIRNLTS